MLCEGRGDGGGDARALRQSVTARLRPATPTTLKTSTEDLQGLLPEPLGRQEVEQEVPGMSRVHADEGHLWEITSIP